MIDTFPGVRVLKSNILAGAGVAVLDPLTRTLLVGNDVLDALSERPHDAEAIMRGVRIIRIPGLSRPFPAVASKWTPGYAPHSDA